MTLYIGRELLESVGESARQTWPTECCGILIGSRTGDTSHVLCTRPADNVVPGDRRTRYELDPQVLYGTIRMVQHEGRQIVGFYHSHPNGSTAPSEHDRQSAWPDRSYLIIGVQNRQVTGHRAWRLPAGATEFIEDSVETALITR